MKRIIILCTLVNYAHGTTVVNTFTETIRATVFDRATGNFYVGLNAGAGTDAISVANPPTFGQNSTFTGIVKSETLNGQSIAFLTLATSLGNTNPILGIVTDPVNQAVEPKVVIATNSDGGGLSISPILLDASGAVNVNGLQTNGVVGIAASQNFMFAAVMPCGGLFGANCNGGIASISINQSSLALTQVPAVAGDNGIKAIALDPTTPEVLINNSPTIVPNTVDLFWDHQLQRLYIGLQLTSAGTSSSGETCPVGTGTCYTGSLCATCPTGWFCNNALQQCVTCASGGYFNTASQTCINCPTGQTYNPNISQCVTAICPSGSFWSPQLAACVTCPAGYYFDQNTLQCLVCPNGGIYVDGSGCSPCPAGQSFNPNLGACTGPLICPPGQVYVPQLNACITTPTCPAGYTFSPADITCVAINPTGPIPPLVPDIVPTTPVFKSENTPASSSIFSWAGPIGVRVPIHIPSENRLQTRSTSSGAKSVVVASVDSSGIITFADIAPDAAFISGAGIQNYMVGVFDATPDSLAINKVRVMHASTGPSYLIINGGNGTITNVGNQIYALPLVDLGDPTNAAQGTLAAKNSALVDYKFVTPAATNTDLPLNTDPAAMVGAGPLSIPPSQSIGGIDVVGDTVYVSLNGSTTAASDSGILYSEALFDETGKIIRWTPWTKKAFPPYAVGSQTNITGVAQFAVDASLAKIWAVNSATNTVLQTAWQNNSTDSTSLIAQLNLAIRGTTTTDCASGLTSCVARAVLDLDQSTRGFTANQSRYALFSGSGSVIFARISQALGASVSSPQTVTTNFSLASNFLVSDLPTDACQATVMEYARQLTGNTTNYFFAGTQNGLYVFSNGGAGFDVSTLGALDAPPFSTGSWQLAPTITGEVFDIKTTGNVLYVLAETASQSTLYLIPFQPSVSSMFTPANIFILAQTGTGIFADISVFNAIQIISTMADGSTEQLVLATNNGLYQSTKTTGVQQATSQTDAAWTLITNTLSFYTDIAGVDNASIPVASPSTIWPFYIADQNGLGTFNRSVIQQLNGSQNTVPFAFVPPLFDSTTAGTDTNFATLPLFSYFWSDGARRIFTVDNIQSSCLPEQLMCLPFNAAEWDITNPNEALLNDPIFSSVSAFYWVKQIGVSGILMVGTDKGVIGLA